MSSSYTPCVDGYVTMIAASRSRCSVDLRPQVVEVDRAVVGAPTTTTRMPAITADAALVPCADDGIRHTSRCDWSCAR